MVGTLTSFKVISSDLDMALKRVAQQPTAAREVKYFKENIQKIKSVDEFVGDRRIFAFAMQAMGLGDMTYAKAFMAKVLNEGVDDPRSFANSLSDSRYKEFAETFNFKAFGAATTSFDAAQSGVVDKYLQQTLEQQEGDKNDGVRLALYFQRKAPEVNSFLGILADKALSTVVRTALGLPDALGASDLDKQIEVMSKRMSIEDLKSPEGLSKFLERFTSLWDVTHDTSTASSSGVGLLFNQTGQLGISTDTMLQIQLLKRG